jgi:GH25 family lysozyme M1 (1,4-beta-N-acetylmuramidase)
MRTLGVDVSHWEGDIDWKVAAPTLGFAYYKCTDGVKFVDPRFATNRQGCNLAGLAHAPYHYYQPEQDPVAQAVHFIKTAGKDYQKYIVDMEEPVRVPDITQKLHTFLMQVEKLCGSRPVIYTSPGYWNDFMQPYPQWSKDYELIVAHYTLAHHPTLPHGWTDWRMWQFSDDWNFRGCNERADANWFNGNLAACHAWFGNARLAPLISGESGGLKLRSLFNELHIRQSPNLKARVIASLEKGEQVQVEELGGYDVWIRHARGWTAVEIEDYRYMEVVNE